MLSIISISINIDCSIYLLFDMDSINYENRALVLYHSSFVNNVNATQTHLSYFVSIRLLEPLVIYFITTSISEFIEQIIDYNQKNIRINSQTQQSVR